MATVALDDGTIVNASDAATAQQVVSEGGRAVSAAEAQAFDKDLALREKYNPLIHPLNAAGAYLGAGATGWWRGITAGMSDIALAKAGDALGLDARGTLNELKQVHPLISASEEMSGFAGSAAVGGEALGVGRAATMAGRVAQGAARGGIEMGLYESGKAAADAALANEEITAQKVIAGGKHGLVMGLIGGGALSFAAEGLGAARGAFRAGEGAERPALARAGEKAPIGGVRQQVGTALEEMRNEHTIKALGGSKGDVRILNKTVDGGAARVADDIRAFVKEETGKIAPSRTEMKEAVDAGLERMTAQKHSMLARLDDARVGIAPDVKTVAKKIQAELINPYLNENGMPMFGAESRVAAAKDAIARMERSFGDDAPTFQKWSKSLTEFRNEINFAKRNADPIEGTLAQISGIMRGELDAAGDRAAGMMGESFSESYNANQKLMQSLIKGRDMLERGIAGEFSNNSLGLTSRIAGIVGGAAGSLGAGPIGGIVGGGAATLAGKIIQNKGDMLAAELLERVSGVLGVRRLAATTDTKIASGVASVLGKGRAVNDAPKAASTSFAGRGSSPRKNYEVIEKQLTQLRANPIAASARVEKSLGDLPMRAPALSSALVATTMRGAEYLASKLPRTFKDSSSIQPQLQKANVSDSDVAKFMRVAEAVNDPTIVLKEARRGTLTRDHVEAVKAVYPDVYQQIRETVMREVIDTKQPLTYQRRIQLGILLELPTDRTLAPAFTRAMQATYSASDSAAEEPSHNQAPLNTASSLETAMQAATSEGQVR